MAERVTDLRDIERRVVARLVGEPEPGVPDARRAVGAGRRGPRALRHRRPPAVVVVGLVTERGGPDQPHGDHRPPARHPLRGRHPRRDDHPGRQSLLVDGTAGTVELDPDEPRPSAAWRRTRRPARALASWSGPGATADGKPIKILANVADGESARSAAEAPVEGVGLFRTELCFLNRKEEPTRRGAGRDLRRGAERLRASGPGDADRYVVVRTLDAGSDKPVAFATMEGEENPALGVRGLRLSFGNPGLLERQLDGVALAARETGTETWVMAPMVATVAEAEEFATRCATAGSRPA